MVKRCAWGTCNSDSRYPDRLVGGISFIPFPKLGRSRAKALRWIRLCGRPVGQLSVEILAERKRAKHIFVCTKHFIEGKPTLHHPDPFPALLHDKITECRKPPKPRMSAALNVLRQKTEENVVRVPLPLTPADDIPEDGKENLPNPIVPFENEFHQLNLLAMAAENRQLTQEKQRLSAENFQLKSEPKGVTINQNFNFSNLSHNLFQYYTGFSFERFMDLYIFLVPGESLPLKFSKNATSLINMPLKDQVLFVLIKLRQDFDFKHLSNLFNISTQDCSTLFSNWMNYMFFRLGSICIWPNRDVIVQHMPEEFKKDYPNTMVIIDGTEIKIERPTSLVRQSQCYSDYKSCTTLKGLVGVDPKGSIIFSSMLFSGSISDKELTSQSGFLTTLQDFLKNGKLKKGDGIMADKGFTIKKEIQDLGLVLNIPPFVPCNSQMNISEVNQTIKIAKHRVHVERAISRVKQFKILANKINLSLFSNINQIWLVCCLLTNFMPFLIQK